MKRKFIVTSMALLAGLSLTSCLKGEADQYDEWREKNESYIVNLNQNEYELIVPDWAPQNSVYIKWHNDRSVTANNLVAMSNSTVNIKYELHDIDGNLIDSSYHATDSIYQSKPNANIIGMWIAMTTMHVGDSATVVIPYPSAYGSASSGKVKPYSDLIFDMKIKSIPAFETTPN